MTHKFYRKTPGAVSSPINIVDVEGTWADWIQAVAGGQIVFTDGSGTVVTDSFGAGDVIPGPIHAITSSAGAIRYGTGPMPIPGPTAASAGSATNAATSETNAASSATAAASSATAAASSATAAASSATTATTQATNAGTSATAAAASAACVGVQKSFAGDSLAADTTTETIVGYVLGTCNVDPTILPAGAVTADDTNYATLTFKLYHGGSATQTWTKTTKITGGSAWVSGTAIAQGSPHAAAAGDWVSVAVAKSGTGVQLPAHGIGFKVS